MIKQWRRRKMSKEEEEGVERSKEDLDKTVEEEEDE